MKIGTTIGLAKAPVTMELNDLTRHAIFVGSSGSGKTTVALSMVEQALAAGIPVVMIDRKGDLAAYGRESWWQADPDRAALRERVSVQVWTPGNTDGRAMAIPIAAEGLAHMSDQQRQNASRHAAFSLGEMLGYKASTAGDRAKISVLLKTIELIGLATEQAPTIELIAQVIGDRDPTLVASMGSMSLKVMTRVADDLEALRLIGGSLVDGSGEPMDIGSMFGGRPKLTIISTKFLRDEQSLLFWVSRFAAELSSWASANPSSDLQALVLFDEADVYMPANSKPVTKEPMMDLLRRARSAGIGVLLATQSPGDVDYKSRDNIGTWLVGRVAERTALKKMASLLGDVDPSKVAQQGTGEFQFITGGHRNSIKADPSLMRTEQVPEHEIEEMARGTSRFT